jgi:hypothetical protein
LKETALHAVRYEPGDKTLLVTFDHLDATYDEAGQPEPWAFKFAVQNGWSILGVVSKKHVWFREEALHDVLVDLEVSGFFANFDKVVFAGGSKGGYGALAFSSLCPGATVIAINPQSTLDIGLAPWEKRYPVAPWSGRFKDGAEEAKSANTVYLFYDPYCELDRLHAVRIAGPNTVQFRCWYLEHAIATCFQKMGILKEVMGGIIRGDLTETGFWQLYRARRRALRFARNLFVHTLEKGHYRLALRVCDSQISGPDSKYFRMRKAMFIAKEGSFREAHSLLRECDEW